MDKWSVKVVILEKKVSYIILHIFFEYILKQYPYTYRFIYFLHSEVYLIKI